MKTERTGLVSNEIEGPEQVQVDLESRQPCHGNEEASASIRYRKVRT